MKSGYVILLLLLISFPKILFSQGLEDQTDLDFELAVESIATSEEGDVDNSVMLEDLTSNLEHPINVNMANENELERLNRLNFSQIQQILTYRKEFGYFSSPYELIITVFHVLPNAVMAAEISIAPVPATVADE